LRNEAEKMMQREETASRIVDKRRNWEARVEMEIFKRPKEELSVYDKMVYSVLCGHANREGNAMLYVKTIAGEASCSERQAQRALSNLEECGLLVRRPNFSGEQGQTFNLYEVYGFDSYNPQRAAAEDGVTGSRRCQSDAPGVTDSHSPGDCVAGVNKVLEQLQKNSKKYNTLPPAPQGAEPKGEAPKMVEREKTEIEDEKPQKPEHDTEEKGKAQQSCPEAAFTSLFETIRRTYNEVLPELPQAEKITASRAKTLKQRIRENPERKQVEWWEKFFARVREFPWPMGSNKDKWRADFDWLVGERGMQKILEGSFQKALPFGGSAMSGLELQKKYTDSEGRVDARAMLRDLQRASACR
jgi:hypothetical protein